MSLDPPLRFDAKRALFLLRLIGQVYVDHLVERFGSDPSAWKPAGMRRNYERYLSLPPPQPFRSLRSISWEAAPDDRRSIGRVYARGLSRYLVFRGTLTESEWFRDLMLHQRPCPVDAGVGVDLGRIHRGFGRIYRTLLPAPGDADLRPRWGGRLYVAGHSLGGVLAVLAALELRHLKPRVYTFGTPRIGNQTFAAAATRLLPEYMRIENYWDPIIDLPREETNLVLRRYAYRHAGSAQTVFALTQEGGESLEERVRARLDPLEYLRRGGDIDPLFTHQLSAYERALAKLT